MFCCCANMFYLRTHVLAESNSRFALVTTGIMCVVIPKCNPMQDHGHGHHANAKAGQLHHPWDRPPEQLSKWQCTHQQLRHTQEPCTRVPLTMHVDTTSATASPAGEAILGSPGLHFQAKPSCLPAGTCHCHLTSGHD